MKKKDIHIPKDHIELDKELETLLLNNGYKILKHVKENDKELIKVELEDVIPKKIRQALKSVVQAIAMAVELRDPYTAGHQARVADISRIIAKEMGIQNGDGLLEGIRIAASIHDIGKLAIPSDILSKPTKLTETEKSLIEIHPLKGYEILKEIDFPWPVAEIVYQHHERMNGSGYPRGIKGKDIHIGAKIIAVADVLEAMSSHRPYRPAIGIEKAIEEIRKGKGKLYDKDVVKACLMLYKKGVIKL